MTITISDQRYSKPDNSIVSMTVTGWQNFGPIPFAYDPNDTAPLTLAVKAILDPATVAPYVAPTATKPPVTSAGVDSFAAQRLASGFVDTTTGKTYQCDPASQGKWTAIGSSAGMAIVMQTTPAPNFSIITADNSLITLSAADTFALMDARILPWVSATMLYARNMKTMIAAGTPPSDITVGWP